MRLLFNFYLGASFLFVVISCDVNSKGPFFWKAEKGSRVIHILGTIHLGVTLEELQCSQNIYNSLINSDLLFTENNVSGSSLCVNKKYSDLIEEQELSILQQALDVQIQQIAQSKDVKQDYLDEIIDQGENSIKNYDTEEYIQNIKDMCNLKIEQYKILKKYKFIQKYKTGKSIDFLKIYEIETNTQGFTDDEIKGGRDMIEQKILKERNEIWVQKLVSAHAKEQNENVFVAAGLLHFTGPYNVLDMLKKEGFSVERFNASCSVD